jgi:hypothetical protein
MLGSRSFFVNLLKLSRQVPIKDITSLQNEFMKLSWQFEQNQSNLFQFSNYFGVESLSKGVRKLAILFQSKKDITALPEYYYGLPLLGCLQRINDSLQRLTALNHQFSTDMREMPLQGVVEEASLKDTSQLLQNSQRLANSILCF